MGLQTYREGFEACQAMQRKLDCQRIPRVILATYDPSTNLSLVLVDSVHPLRALNPVDKAFTFGTGGLDGEQEQGEESFRLYDLPSSSRARFIGDVTSAVWPGSAIRPTADTLLALDIYKAHWRERGMKLIDYVDID